MPEAEAHTLEIAPPRESDAQKTIALNPHQKAIPARAVVRWAAAVVLIAAGLVLALDGSGYAPSLAALFSDHGG
jgi:hypothetical protein